MTQWLLFFILPFVVLSKVKCNDINPGFSSWMFSSSDMYAEPPADFNLPNNDRIIMVKSESSKRAYAAGTPLTLPKSVEGTLTIACNTRVSSDEAFDLTLYWDSVRMPISKKKLAQCVGDFAVLRRHITTPTPGDHKIMLMIESFSVPDQYIAVESVNITSCAEESDYTILIISIVSAVLVVGIILFLIWWRRRRYAQVAI